MLYNGSICKSDGSMESNIKLRCFKCYLKFCNLRTFLMLILTKTLKQTKSNKITITNVTLS